MEPEPSPEEEFFNSTEMIVERRFDTGKVTASVASK